jgi:signal transduction histidine kinase
MSLSQDDEQRTDVLRGVVRLDADVHEQVIEQLSAVRLTLRGVEGALNGGPLASRLRDSMAELDDATDQLRGTARPRLLVPPAGDAGLAGRLLDVVIQASPPLTSAPDLQFSGMDVALPEGVEAALGAMLRRALTDVGKQTADVEVRVAATTDRLTAQVTGYGSGTDPGRIGPDAPDGRARDHDGASSIERRQHGTRLTWAVPLPGPDAVHGRPPTAVLPAPHRSADGRSADGGAPRA